MVRKQTILELLFIGRRTNKLLLADFRRTKLWKLLKKRKKSSRKRTLQPETNVAATAQPAVESADPPAPAQPRGRRARANAADWSQQALEFALLDSTVVPGPKLPEEQEFADPVAVLDLFWKDLRSLLVTHTNCSAHCLLSNPDAPAYLRPWKEVNDAEMDVFLAIITFMGIKELPNDGMYWQQGAKWGEATVYNNMSRTRFFQLKRCLSVASPTAEQNQQDKLAKGRSAIDVLLHKSALYYVPTQDLSLDEPQILCCGRNARCAHRGDKHNIKPLKDYIKSFGLHESGTG